jgi:hypothetical protein
MKKLQYFVVLQVLVLKDIIHCFVLLELTADKDFQHLMNLHFFMFVGLDYNIGVFLQLPNFLMG